MSLILKLKNKMNMKNLIKYGFIAVVICFCSCSEFAHNSNKFYVESIIKVDREEFQYVLKPTKGLGTLYLDTKESYNVGDTLTLSPNCR